MTKEKRVGIFVTVGLLILALGELAGDLLAELDAELVERIDPHQDRVGEGPVLVERNERAKRARVEAIEENGHARPVA